jgi:hypothetical protein
MVLGGDAVLVDEAAEPVVPADRAGGRPRDRLCWLAGLGRSGAERAVRFPEEEGVELRRTASGKGDGVLATRPFGAGETVMVGFLVGALTGNDSHATQVGPGRWALHGGLGPKVNHSCDPVAVSASTTGRPLTSSPASRSAQGRS